MPIVSLVDDPTINASCSPLKILQQKVSKAYFAKREEESVEKPDKVNYVAQSGDSLPKIAKKFDVKVSDLTRTGTSDGLWVGETVIVKKMKKVGVKVKFTKIDEVSIGNEAYVIVETEYLQDEKLIIEILQGEEDVLVKKDQAVTVLYDGNYTSCIETTVGAYCDEEEITNKDDFIDWGISKVQFKPENDDKKKEWEEGLNCAGSKKAHLYLYIDAHTENLIPNFQPHYMLYDGFKGGSDNSFVPNHFLNEDNQWFTLKQSGIIDIYQTGEISKLEFKELENITYVYHDAKGNQHNICTCELLEIDERLKGKAHDQDKAHTVESGYDANNIITYSHASSRKKYSYPNGTIRTYGKHGKKYRRVLYKKGTTKKHIVKLPDGLNKEVGGKTVKFSFTSTARTFCGPEHFACFIGALAEVGYKDIVSGGMCEEDGTCFPSTTHNNGQSVDTNYIDDDEREQKFIDALHKFGFDYQLRGHAKKKFKNTTAKSHHNSHLHSGGLKPNYKK